MAGLKGLRWGAEDFVAPKSLEKMQQKMVAVARAE